MRYFLLMMAIAWAVGRVENECGEEKILTFHVIGPDFLYVCVDDIEDMQAILAPGPLTDK